MDDFSPEFSEKIRNAYAQGHTPEQIISHFESTNHPEGMRWANQMKELQGGSDVIPMSTPSVNTAPSFRDTSTPLIDTYTRNAELLKTETKDMSLKDQAIAGAEIAAGLYAGKKAIDISSRMLHNLTPQGKLEIEKARAELEASKESSKNYAIQTQTAAKKLELEQQLAANAQPSSLDELKAQALMNEERRKQELHDIKMDQLKQKVIKGQTQVDKIAASSDVMQSPEILNSTGFTGLTELEKNKGVTFANSQGPELKSVLKAENITAIKNGQPPPYPHLASNPVTPPEPMATTGDLLAAQAGVTPSTSIPEAETLVTTAEAAKNPAEKALEIKESVKPSAVTKEGVPVPEGRIPNYMEFKTKKGGTKEFKNKQGSDVIGKGGYNWYQGQMGPEAEVNWLRTFGRTNQSYGDVVQAIKEGRLQGPIVNEAGKGGSFAREPHVPNYIKGNASLGAMAGTGITAALLALAGSEKGQEAMSKASKAIKDIGVSPDIFTNKGEELGNLGTSYITAGNPSYQRELLQELQKTKNAKERNILLQELQKLPNSGSGIAPPRMR
jgi:hypothetical protein